MEREREREREGWRGRGGGGSKTNVVGKGKEITQGKGMRKKERKRERVCIGRRSEVRGGMGRGGGRALSGRSTWTAVTQERDSRHVPSLPFAPTSLPPPSGTDTFSHHDIVHNQRTVTHTGGEKKKKKEGRGRGGEEEEEEEEEEVRVWIVRGAAGDGGLSQTYC